MSSKKHTIADLESLEDVLALILKHPEMLMSDPNHQDTAKELDKLLKIQLEKEAAQKRDNNGK